MVQSIINKNIAEELKNNWNDFKKALKNLESILKDMKIGVSRFSGSWNVLLPIIYFIYYNPDYRNNLDGIRAYLTRAVLFTYFQSGTTSKLQQMKSRINENEHEISVEMLNQMNDLRVTDGKIEDILNEEKGSRVAGEALFFLSLDWRNSHFKYEQDHLHPFERFDGNKPICRFASINPPDIKFIGSLFSPQQKRKAMIKCKSSCKLSWPLLLFDSNI